MRKGFARHVALRLQAFENRTRVLSGERHSGPLISHGYHDDTQSWPLALAPFLEPLSDSPCAAAGRRDQYAVLIECDHGAVIENDAGLAQHDAVTRTLHFKSLEIVDVEAIGEFE